MRALRFFLLLMMCIGVFAVDAAPRVVGTELYVNIFYGVYGPGEPFYFKVIFDQPVKVTKDSAGALSYIGIDSKPTVTFAYCTGETSGIASTAVEFLYVPQEGIYADKFEYTGVNALLSGSITNVGLTPVIRTLPAPGATGSLSKNHHVVIAGQPDAVPPRVVYVSSSKVSGTYGAGDPIDITVKFSEPVGVTYGTPTPRLQMNVINAAATGPIFATYAGVGSGTDTLTFTYTPTLGDTAVDLDAVGFEIPVASDGSVVRIKDGRQNAILSSLPTGAAAGSLSINKAIVIATIADTVAPTLLSVTTTSTDGIYVTGQEITLIGVFSEPVGVTGAPSISLKNFLGSTDMRAIYRSGSGTAVLQFVYTVSNKDSTPHLDWVGTDSLRLTGSSIRDTANNALVTLPAPGATGSLSASHSIAINPPELTGIGKPVPASAPNSAVSSSGCGLSSGFGALLMFAFLLTARLACLRSAYR